MVILIKKKDSSKKFKIFLVQDIILKKIKFPNNFKIILLNFQVRLEQEI
jgi:hypothetical protein